MKTENPIKINIKEVRIKVVPISDSRFPDLLARVSLILIDDKNRKLRITGFTLRKSKFDGKPYLTPPSKKSGKNVFQFVLTDNALWKEIEKDAVELYEREQIPIIEEELIGNPY